MNYVTPVNCHKPPPFRESLNGTRFRFCISNTDYKRIAKLRVWKRWSFLDNILQECFTVNIGLTQFVFLIYFNLGCKYEEDNLFVLITEISPYNIF